MIREENINNNCSPTPMSDLGLSYYYIIIIIIIINKYALVTKYL